MIVEAIGIERLLLVGAVVIGGGAVGIGFVVAIVAVGRAFAAKRSERIRKTLRQKLFESLHEETDWDSWVAGLSRAERRELKGLLDIYLRRFRGSEREALCDIAAALGIPDSARRTVIGRGDRRQALTWLALLGESVAPETLRKHCKTPELRAHAARVLHASNHPKASIAGTELLVGDGQRPLSAFALDTLYRLNRSEETPLLTMGATDGDSWDERLLVQVCVVLRFCQADEPAARFEWVLPLLGHDSNRVRLAAVGVLARHGWRPDFRNRIDFEQLFSDPHPDVRRGAYFALAAWGDIDSLERLLVGVHQEREESALLAAVQALAAHPLVADLPTEESLQPYVEWVAAEASVGGRRERARGVATWT